MGSIESLLIRVALIDSFPKESTLNPIENNLTDVDLVYQLKQGDAQSLGQLWECLYRDGIKVVRRFNYSDDLGLDAAVRAYEKLTAQGIDKFQFKSSFRTYCWTIISRELLRLIKKEGNCRQIDLEKVQLKADDVIEGQISPEILLARLQPCIDNLNGNRRAVFVMVDLEQRSPADVAKTLGISRNNVNKIATRARLDMRRCLQGRGFSSCEELLSL